MFGLGVGRLTNKNTMLMQIINCPFVWIDLNYTAGRGLSHIRGLQEAAGQPSVRDALR